MCRTSRWLACRTQTADQESGRRSKVSSVILSILDRKRKRHVLRLSVSLR